MIKNIVSISIIFVTLFMSCNNNVDQKSNNSEPKEEKKVTNQTTDVSLDIDKLVNSINDRRTEIESKIDTPIEALTLDLKEKIKQKWEKIHFYTLENEVVRIKAYPYPNISKRTEEFYLNEGQLILAVIEDEGEGDRGKPQDKIDKVYYFNKNQIIKELHIKKEVEYSVKNSDGEELISELNEYLDIYSNKIKKSNL